MTEAVRQLWNNLSSIILSLLLAVAVWVAATLQNDPFDVRKVAAVPVTPLNQPENTVFFEGDPAWVSVDARAQQSVLDLLKASDFEAVMDLSIVEPGVLTSVPISVTSTVDAVRIEFYEPQEQNVLLEALGSISMPVDIEIVGQVATGYYASTRTTVTPSEVAVYGPVPYLEGVVSVNGIVNIEGANQDIVERVSIAPRNADGQLVTGVEWSPEQVEVRISVLRRVGYKPEVRVVPDVRGEPAPGYRRGSVAVAPSTITLAGPPRVLNELPGFVRTEPITITGMTAVLTERVPLSMPDNIVAVGVNYVTVTISILPVLSSRAMTSTIEIQGLRQEWTATVSPQVVDVILVGPDTLLSELKPDDIQVFVNLFGLGLGVHRVEPVVLYPEDVELESVIPDVIEVVIRVEATPVPLTSPLPIDTPAP
jgi:YbbR domain-containing protein